MKNIADVIQLLLRSGMTQTEVAEQSGVPQCRISRWSRGKAARAADDALKLVALANDIGSGSKTVDGLNQSSIGLGSANG